MSACKMFMDIKLCSPCHPSGSVPDGQLCRPRKVQHLHHGSNARRVQSDRNWQGSPGPVQSLTWPACSSIICSLLVVPLLVAVDLL